MLLPNERLDDLVVDGLRIIQDDSAFCFSMDAVLLAHFATIHRADRVVDLGTGTGVIPLLLTTRAEDLQVIGLELQPEVAERAQRSVDLNGLTQQVRILCGDLRQVERILRGHRVELVTSNPPYLPVGSGEASPRTQVAMARHEVCCCLADVMRAAAYLLGSSGRFALVHRPGRLVEILAAMSALRLEPKRLRLVHPRAGKEPNLVLIEGIKDARPGLQILPPLVVYEGDKYTPELLEIYYRDQQGGI